MAYQDYEFTPISIRISSYTNGGTLLHRVADNVRFEYAELGDSCSVLIKVDVHVHAALAGSDEPGQRLEGGNFVARPAEFRADNNTLVDTDTGAILTQRQPGQSDDDWQAEIDSLSLTHNTRLQLKHFQWMRDHKPLLFGETLRGHILQADAMGRFAT